MSSPRARLRMPESDVADLLHSNWSMVFGTLDHSGRPHLVNMAYGFVGEQLAFTSYIKAQKIVNLRRDNRLSGLIEELGGSYDEIRGVQLLGAARLDEDATTVQTVLRAVVAQMHLAGRTAVPDSSSLQEISAKRIAVFFDVDRIISWDHRRLVTPQAP